MKRNLHTEIAIRSLNLNPESSMLKLKMFILKKRSLFKGMSAENELI